MAEKRITVVKKTCRFMLKGLCEKKNCSMTCARGTVSRCDKDGHKDEYFAADEQL